MRKFHIHFKDELAQIDEETFAVGEIKILNFTESFHSSITYWSKGDYINQWEQGLERIRQRLASSCFVTSMYDPVYANFIFWWVVYLEDEWAYLQNHLLFLNQLNEPFQEENIYNYIPKREIYTEDGVKISEWKIRIEDIG